MKINLMTWPEMPEFNLGGIVDCMCRGEFEYIYERCINYNHIEPTERIRNIEQELFCENFISGSIEIIHIDIKNRDLWKVLAWLVAFRHAIWLSSIYADSSHYGEDGNTDWIILRTSEKAVVIYDFNVLTSSQKCMNALHEECVFDLIEAVRNCGEVYRLEKLENSQIVFRSFDYKIEKLMLAIRLESYREYSNALEEMTWRANKRLDDINNMN